MRISYKFGIRTISGKLEGLIHMAWNKGRVAIGRIFMMPTLVASHYKFRDIKHNIAAIWKDCSSEFKDDLKVYASKRIPFYTPEQIPAYANYAHFVRLLYNFAKEEGVDLTDASISDLETAGCPSSVAESIEAGFLPGIPDYHDLTNDW